MVILVAVIALLAPVLVAPGGVWFVRVVGTQEQAVRATDSGVHPATAASRFPAVLMYWQLKLLDPKSIAGRLLASWSNSKMANEAVTL